MHVQAFNWECHSIRDQSRKPAWLQMLADKADAIADAGITAVWLPPPCQAISDEARPSTPSATRRDCVLLTASEKL